MTVTDTAGRFYYYIERCACCHLSTGGQHEGDCPMRTDIFEYRSDNLGLVPELDADGQRIPEEM